MVETIRRSRISRNSRKLFEKPMGKANPRNSKPKCQDIAPAATGACPAEALLKVGVLRGPGKSQEVLGRPRKSQEVLGSPRQSYNGPKSKANQAKSNQNQGRSNRNQIQIEAKSKSNQIQIKIYQKSQEILIEILKESGNPRKSLKARKSIITRTSFVVPRGAPALTGRLGVASSPLGDCVSERAERARASQELRRKSYLSQIFLILRDFPRISYYSIRISQDFYWDSIMILI